MFSSVLLNVNKPLYLDCIRREIIISTPFLHQFTDRHRAAAVPVLDLKGNIYLSVINIPMHKTSEFIFKKRRLDVEK